jgi:hypothetical protein
VTLTDLAFIGGLAFGVMFIAQLIVRNDARRASRKRNQAHPWRKR